MSITEAETVVVSTLGTESPRQHIVPRMSFLGPMAEKALCGYAWDRTKPKGLKFCERCLELFKAKHPDLLPPTI